MARASGLAPSTVQCIWKAFSLQPPPQRDLQAVNRSALRREGARHRMLRGAENEPHAAYILDQRWSAGRVDLTTQLAKMHVN